MQPALPAGWVERAAGRVAVEDRDRVAEEGADVDVAAVGADDDDVRADQRRGRRRSREAAAPEMQPAAAASWRSAPVERLRRKTVTALLPREVA